MNLHIDVVESDFQSAHQVRVARLGVHPAGYEFMTADPGRWSRVLGLSAPPPLTNLEDAWNLLSAIAKRLDGGDYLYALGPHVDDECPFANGDTIPMGTQPAPAQPQPVAGLGIGS